MPRTLILGRFQPPHMGHLHSIRSAARGGREVIVAVGSAQESYTAANPFTAGERLEMLRAAVAEEGILGVQPLALADIHRHAEWVAYVRSMVPPFDAVLTNNPLTKVLFSEARCRVLEGELYKPDLCSGTAIRARLARGESVDDAVPKAVAEILKRIGAGERLRMLSRSDRG